MLKRLDTSMTAHFDLLGFLDGETWAEGLFEDRGGRLKRRFTVELVGRREGRRLILDEAFRFDDGEELQRTWLLDPASDGTFTGRCEDAPVPARGLCTTGEARMQSKLLVAVGSRRIALDFEDAFYPVDARTVVNRSRMSKWGFTVGQVLILFRKA